MSARADIVKTDDVPVTVVVGVAVDSPTCERAQNLHASLSALRAQTLPRNKYRVVLVEQGSTPLLQDTEASIVDDYVFAYSPRRFNRSWVLNIGAATARAGVICTFDADLIVPPDFLRRGLLAWQCGALAIKPFRKMLYMDPETTEWVRQQLHAGCVIDCEDPTFGGGLHQWSKGGCLWIDAQIYREVGGHDERFEGWGDEDREFWERLTRRTSVVVLEGRLLHLYHARDFEQRSEVRANRLLWRALQHGLLPRQTSRATGKIDRYHAERARIDGTVVSTPDNRHARLHDAILEAATSVCRGEPVSDIQQARRLQVQATLSARAGDLAIASACLTRAIELEPSTADYYMDLACVLWRKGLGIEAVRTLLRALVLRPDDPEPLRELGRVLYQMGRFHEALLAYQEALQLDLGDTATLGELGEVFCALGRVDSALGACAVAQRLAPDDPGGYVKLGNVRLARGEWDLALVAFRDGLTRLDVQTTHRDDHRSHTPHHSLATIGPLSNNEGNDRIGPVDRHAVALHLGTGKALLQLGAPDEAARSFARALMLSPTNTEAARHLALARESRGHDAETAAAWTTLSGALEALHRFEEAAIADEQAIACKQDCLKAWIHLGRARAARGEQDEAIRSFDVALAIHPNHVVAHDGLGRARYTAGSLELAWQEFAWWCSPARLRTRVCEQPAWDGSPLQGKTILAWADQELGDTIHWVRYAAALNRLGARVILECQSRLVPLVRTVPGIDLVVGRGSPLPDFDLHAPLTLIPIVSPYCRARPCAAPYFQADAALVEYWHERLACTGRTRRPRRPFDARDGKDPCRFRVGISWAGHPEGINATSRFAPLAAFAPLAGLHGVGFVSLQMGQQAAELHEEPAGLPIEHIQDEFCSTSDTAALMQSLDLVLTVDTMVAHLAGALGRPVWLLLPYVADWRWLRDPDRSPLYPSMRLFRQHRPGDWTELFGRVRAALQERHGSTREGLEAHTDRT